MRSKYVFSLLVFLLVAVSSLFLVRSSVEAASAHNEVEQRILSSTVQVEWQVWQLEVDEWAYSRFMSFATVREGRYLVTHNHHDIPLSEPDNKALVKVSIYTADGKLIWSQAPGQIFTIEEENSETLILDFGGYRGERLFESMGIPSAEFKTWELLSLKPGMEVAQIDWDNEIGHVEWVLIKDVITENGIPRLILDNHVVSGSSGGGVFWNGYHIANTWSQVMVYDENRETVMDQFSVAALNSYSSNSASTSLANVSKSGN
jgi:hypothetical protein